MILKSIKRKKPVLIKEYVDVDENESQYCEHEPGVAVDARYVVPELELDKGKELIEALPRYCSDTSKIFKRRLQGYNKFTAKNLPYIEKLLAVNSLRNVRLELTFYERVNFEIYRCLVESYRSRKLLLSCDETIEEKVGDQEVRMCGISTANAADSTNGTFSLIGTAGSGKSAAINLALAYYPQTIVHYFDNGNKCIQIVYLVINCTPNHNFSQLFISIGEAVDKALGHITPSVANVIRKARSVGEKAEKVIEIINKFAIGMIVIDEIQNMKMDDGKNTGTKSGDSFEHFMNIANRTKVAIAVVGTEDARKKMFRVRRTARRVGLDISSDFYCTDYDFFKSIVLMILRYQWTDESIKLNESAMQVLYKLSFGLIDQLVSIYICCQLEYINMRRRNNPVVFDARFIEKTATKYYGNMYKDHPSFDTIDGAKKYYAFKSEGDARIAKAIDEAEQSEKARKLIENTENEERVQSLLESVTVSLKNVGNYSDKSIEKAFATVMAKRTYDETKLRELNIAVREFIESETAKHKLGEKESIDSMREKLGLIGKKDSDGVDG